jgi:hypothetical protein
LPEHAVSDAVEKIVVGLFTIVLLPFLFLVLKKWWEGSTQKPPTDPTEKKRSVGVSLESLEKVQDMLTVAASACNLTAKKSRGKQYLGVKLDEKYYVSVSVKEPNKLWFVTMRRIDPSAAARLGVGEVWQETWIPGRNRWGRSADLNLESVQMDWLVKFLNECLAQARSIETEEVEGS